MFTILVEQLPLLIIVEPSGQWPFGLKDISPLPIPPRTIPHTKKASYDMGVGGWGNVQGKLSRGICPGGDVR